MMFTNSLPLVLVLCIFSYFQQLNLVEGQPYCGSGPNTTCGDLSRGCCEGCVFEITCPEPWCRWETSDIEKCIYVWNTSAPTNEPTGFPTPLPSPLPTLQPSPFTTFFDNCTLVNQTCELYQIAFNSTEFNVTVDECNADSLTRRRLGDYSTSTSSTTQCITAPDSYQYADNDDDDSDRRRRFRRRRLLHGRGRGHGMRRGSNDDSSSHRSYISSSSDSDEDSTFLILTEVCVTYNIIDNGQNCGDLQSIFLPLCENNNTMEYFTSEKLSESKIDKLITSIEPNDIFEASGFTSLNGSLGILITLGNLSASNASSSSFEICFKNVIVYDSSNDGNFTGNISRNFTLNDIEFGTQSELTVNNNSNACFNGVGLPCFNFYFATKRGKKGKKKGGYGRSKRHNAYIADEATADDEFGIAESPEQGVAIWGVVAIFGLFLVLMCFAAYFCIWRNKNNDEMDDAQIGMATVATTNRDDDLQYVE